MREISKRVLLLVLGCSLCWQTAMAQSFSRSTLLGEPELLPDLSPAIEQQSLAERFTGGLRMSFSRMDLPFLALEGFNRLQRGSHLLPVSSFGFDLEVTEHVARADGGSSLGSLNPIYFPLLAGTARLGGMLLLDAVSKVDYSPASYSRLIQFHKAILYTHALTNFSKAYFPRKRPDGSDDRSLFSGHTSVTFATSAFLYMELKDAIDYYDWKNGGTPLLPAKAWKTAAFGALYGWAGYVGYSRIRDRKHYFSDVVLGAIAGTAISHWVYSSHLSNLRQRGLAFSVQPVTGGGIVGLSARF